MVSDPTIFQREIAPLIEDLFASANGHGAYEMVGDPAYEPLGDDCGLTTLTMHARSKLPDGQTRERESVFTGVWRRGSEGWRIVYAHESSTPRTLARTHSNSIMSSST